ncbi:MAG: TolC family protein [Treponemataceae bacterium]|nr:MAG: TolC family protein [Treponemataceae bacterium]
MVKIQFVAVAAAVLFLAMPVTAQSAAQNAGTDDKGIATNDSRTVLTVEDAVQYALKNSTTLKTAAIDLEIKKRADSTSWNTLLPSAQVTGTASRANEVTGAIIPGYPAPETQESDHWRLVGGLSFSWNFNVAMLQSMKATHSSYDAGLITYEQSLRQMERDVRKMFYSLLLMQESLKMQQTSLQNAQSRANQAATSYSNGRVPELQLLQARVALENQRPSVLKLEQQVDQNLATFAFLLGMPYGSKITLEGEIAPDYLELNANALIDRYIGAKLDLQLLNKNIEVMNYNLKASQLSTFTPSLSLSWGLQPAAGLTAPKDDGIDAFTEHGSLSITLAWNLTPLLPWSTQRQQAKDLEQTIAQTKLSLPIATDQAKTEVTKLVDSLALSRSQMGALEANVNMAQRAYTMTVQGYQSGGRELLDVRDAEASLTQAQLGLLNEKLNYLSNLLDLEYALNTKLGK